MGSIFCKICGAENKDEANFCRSCGAALQQNAAIQQPESSAENDGLKNETKEEVRKTKKGKKRFLVFIGLGVLIAAGIGAGSIALRNKQVKQQYENQIETGDKYLEELDYEKAEDAYLQAINIDPKKKEPYLGLIKLYADKGENSKAVEIAVQGKDAVDEEEQAEFQKILEEWQEIVDWTWIVEPTIEADDIYYINSDDDTANAVNNLRRQLDDNFGYAVIKKGDTYGLIDMEGNLLDGMKFTSVSTRTSQYMVTYQEPVFRLNMSQEETQFKLTANGLELATDWGGVCGASGGVYFWAGGLMQQSLTGWMPELEIPIPVQKGAMNNSPNKKNYEDYIEQPGEKYAIYSNGQLVSDFIYDDCGSFADGLIAVCQDGKWGYIDESGKTIIPLEYDASWKEYTPYRNDSTIDGICYAASDGYVVLCRDGEWELRNTEGKTIIQAGVFEKICPVEDGKCWAKKAGKWGVIQVAEENLDLSGWKNAYINEMQNALMSNEENIRFKLIYVNDDEVPELVIDYGVFASGTYLITFDGEKTSEVNAAGGTFYYIEKENRVNALCGHMDLYNDYIYQIQNGKFIAKKTGEYGADAYPVPIDENGEPKYRYVWNYTECTKEEYTEYLNQEVDMEKAQDALEDMSTFGEIISQINQL